MITNTQIFYFLLSLLCLAGLWFLLFILYRQYVVDRFREDMFALRDEIFDFASTGKIGFDSSAYQILRGTTNGFIRFAHKMGLLQLVTFASLAKKEDMHYSAAAFEAQWSEAIGTCPAEVQKQLNTYRMRMNLIALKFVINSSPILLSTILVPLLLFIMLKCFFGRLIEILKQQFNELDAIAFVCGQHRVNLC